MATCKRCGKTFEQSRQGFSRSYCGAECYRLAAHERDKHRKHVKKAPPKTEINQPRSIMRHDEQAVKFVYSPEGWPAGCSFPVTEVKITLHLGYFPHGARFRYNHKLFTVHGREAIAGDGERIK